MRSSLEELVKLHLEEMLRFATRLTGDLESSEELVQEALLRVTRSWSEFRGEASFRTWVYRILINVFRDSLRRSPQQGWAPPREVHEPGPGPVETAEAKDFELLLGSKISQLPSRQREVLVLTSFEGFSVVEVAELLGVSPGNVRANLHYARERLKRGLETYLKG